MSKFDKIKQFLDKGNERTARAKKNILLGIIYKGIGALVGFAYYPIALSYLDQAQFGIFIVITTFVEWFADMDIGIGNGLRNKLGESVARENHLEGRAYVSTAYFIMGAIFSGVMIVFVSASFFVPWAEVVNADPSLEGEIQILAILVVVAFCIRFVSSLIYEIFYALQKTAKVDLYNVVTKVFSLAVILALIFFSGQSLVYFGAARTFSFALIPVLIGIFFFRTSLKRYAPSYNLVNKQYFKSLLSLGSKFFLIRISMVVIHETNNILIAQYVMLEEVPVYEAAFKYFSVLLLIFAPVTNQLWAAFTEAYEVKDFDWIRNIMKKMILAWLGTVGIALVMILLSGFVYDLWLGDKLEIPLDITIMVAISVCLTNWVNTFNLVLNGTSKIQLQMYFMLFASVINIPASIFFAHILGWGTVGIVMGTIISLIPNVILAPIQVSKILDGKAKGIWGK